MLIKIDRQTQVLPVPHQTVTSPPVHIQQRSEDDIYKIYNIAAHKWITIRQLCVRQEEEKKKLHSSKRLMCIIYVCHFGITNYTQNI